MMVVVTSGATTLPATCGRGATVLAVGVVAIIGSPDPVAAVLRAKPVIDSVALAWALQRDVVI